MTRPSDSRPTSMPGLIISQLWKSSGNEVPAADGNNATPHAIAMNPSAAGATGPTPPQVTRAVTTTAAAYSAAHRTGSGSFHCTAQAKQKNAMSAVLTTPNRFDVEPTLEA